MHPKTINTRLVISGMLLCCEEKAKGLQFLISNLTGHYTIKCQSQIKVFLDSHVQSNIIILFQQVSVRSLRNFAFLQNSVSMMNQFTGPCFAKNLKCQTNPG